METRKTESREHIFKCVKIFVFIFKNQAMKKYYCKTGNKFLIFINLITRWKRVTIFMFRL
jgi:hypothetical protein